jgi:lipopolysaccharide transport system ATP-binding protein
MPQAIIETSRLSKQYHIGSRERVNRTFREALSDAFLAPVRNFRNLRRLTKIEYDQDMPDIIWALRDVSFTVNPGEVVGIIGSNGAGKSTLLKILSRITEPTSGEVKLYGRISSLLEVGTGFHPELTGRENIYLSGTILGMRKYEIDSKFDEIVAFSEIEKFLDTPVKRYSSGMYVRLAFAVAAHLEPEILLIDEVLAVGDASFQKKCLGKMNDVAKQGRTVMFVSHNIAAIVSLCSRCLLLAKGGLAEDGDVIEVTSKYQGGIYTYLKDQEGDLGTAERFGNGKARFTALSVHPEGIEDQKQPILHAGRDIEIETTITAYEKIVEANVAITIYDISGYRIIDANTALKDAFLSLIPSQKARVRFVLKKVLLRPGTYLIGLWMGRPNVEDIDGITYARSFTIEMDPREIKHHQVFPGVYQCEFVHSIDIEQNGS